MNISGRTIALLAAAVGLIIAPFLPALTATAALVGTISRSAVDVTGGEALVLCGLALIIGFIGWTAQQTGQARRLPLALTSLVALGYTAYLYFQVDERVQGLAGNEYGFGSIGTGLYLAIGASLLGLGAAVLMAPRAAEPAAG